MRTRTSAYIIDKSCLTAVLAVMKFMRELRDKNKELKREGQMLIPVFMAEDISSAFESISHDLIGDMIEHCFKNEGSST